MRWVATTLDLSDLSELSVFPNNEKHISLSSRLCFVFTVLGSGLVINLSTDTAWVLSLSDGWIDNAADEVSDSSQEASRWG